jgi:glyoxylase-like metal-dependent hydrolase (beta-lactamase superfamily II)
MTPATKLQAITRHLYQWSGFHTQWKIDFDSHALQTPDGLVLIDPLQPAPAVLRQLEQLGAPIAIILTNANHDRDADWFRKHYDIEIYAHEKAQPECDTRIDVLVLDGEKLPGGLTARHLPGSAAGELALFTRLDGGLVIIGDTLLNSAETGLAFLPDEYLADRKLTRQSLQKLLNLNFKVAVFAHGPALSDGAKRHITNFLKKPKKITA